MKNTVGQKGTSRRALRHGSVDVTLSRVINWLQKITECEVKASHALPGVPKERHAGELKQLMLLREFQQKLKAASILSQVRKMYLMSPACFSTLRDIYSLYPKNKMFHQLVRAILFEILPQEMTRLEKDVAGKDVVLHLSCHSRLSKANASIHTFKPTPNSEAHIILMGRRRTRRIDLPSLQFEYRGGRLSVDAPDNYESLTAKLFLGISILRFAGPPRLILKCDDDILLKSRKGLNETLRSFRLQKQNYAGQIVNICDYTDLWHGWHVSKCMDKRLNRRGFQHPVPKTYAPGEHGYLLSKRSTIAATDAFLCMKRFFDSLECGYEDIIMGLAMQFSSISLDYLDLTRHASPYGPACLLNKRDSEDGYDTLRGLFTLHGTTRVEALKLYLSRLERLLKRRGISFEPFNPHRVRR